MIKHCQCGRKLSPRAAMCRSCRNRQRWAGKDPRRVKLIARNIARRKGNRPYVDRDWLVQQYVIAALSIGDIALLAQCGKRTIARWLSRHDIATRDKIEAARIAAKARIGAAHPNWKGGKPHCPVCSREIGYSSRTCMRCQNRSGPANSNWRGRADIMELLRTWCSAAWRPQIFARDGHTCQRCKDGRGGNLQAHHIQPLAKLVAQIIADEQPDLSTAEKRAAFTAVLCTRHEITDLANGITLCEDCHEQVHHS